jgi:y4mF family transcriptional regulator
MTKDRDTKPSQPTLSATELAVRAAESILSIRGPSAEVAATGLASVSHARADSGVGLGSISHPASGSGGGNAFSVGLESARADSGVGLGSISHSASGSGGGNALSVGLESARADSGVGLGSISHPASGSGGWNALVPIPTTKHLGEVIRLARQKRGLSQQLLADGAGVGRRFLSELENGKTTLEFEKILQVATAAGVDLFAKLR